MEICFGISYLYTLVLSSRKAVVEDMILAWGLGRTFAFSSQIEISESSSLRWIHRGSRSKKRGRKSCSGLEKERKRKKKRVGGEKEIQEEKGGERKRKGERWLGPLWRAWCVWICPAHRDRRKWQGLFNTMTLPIHNHGPFNGLESDYSDQQFLILLPSTRVMEVDEVHRYVHVMPISKSLMGLWWSDEIIL